MSLVEITEGNVDDVFTYHAWSDEQRARGGEIRESLARSAKIILKNVPRCPLRTQAVNGLLLVQMQANAAITNEGMGETPVQPSAPTPPAVPPFATSFEDAIENAKAVKMGRDEAPKVLGGGKIPGGGPTEL